MKEKDIIRLPSGCLVEIRVKYDAHNIEHPFSMPTINKKTPSRPWIPGKKPFEMKVDNQKFYNSAKWRKLAKLHKSLNPLCVNFETCGGVAEITDHITPINEGGEKFSLHNLQSLCRHCNAVKTGKQK